MQRTLIFLTLLFGTASTSPGSTALDSRLVPGPASSYRELLRAWNTEFGHLPAGSADSPRLLSIPRPKVVQDTPESPEPDLLEPDDTPGEATTISFGDSISSRLWRAGDVDYFRLRAGPGLIRLQLQDGGTATATLRLWNAEGELLAEAGNWLVADLDTSADYIVQVEGEAGLGGSGAAYSLSTGLFSASLRVGADGTADFTRIAEALAAAAAGDTVLVGPGTYRESVELPEGIRVLSPIAVDVDKLEIGMKLNFDAHVLYEDNDGNEVVAFRFVPAMEG